MSEFIAEHPIIVTAVVKVVVLLLVVLTGLAYLTWFERKVVAHIQSRIGPYRAGPHGLLQPLADGLKFLFKEDPTPSGVDKFVYYLAPFLAMSLALITIAVIPFGPRDIEIFGHRTSLAIAEPNIGILFLFAISSIGVYGVMLAGWSSNSKYPLLGALRSSAQMISYELAMTLSVVGVLLLAGTFNLRDIINDQSGHMAGFIPRWFIFGSPLPQLLGFLCYMTAAIAETNRVPFDLPEAETELVAGFHTEYSSFKFAMFFMAEYANMITVSCLATILFFGGWLSPFPQRIGGFELYTYAKYLPAVLLGLGGLIVLIDGLRYHTRLGKVVLPALGLVLMAAALVVSRGGIVDFVQGPFWFLSKVFLFLFFYVWLRGTLPRFRYDQLMGFGWKFLFPLALFNVVITSFVLVAPEIFAKVTGR